MFLLLIWDLWSLRVLWEKANIKPEQVDEVIMGECPRRRFRPKRGSPNEYSCWLPEFTPAFTINKVCGSGLKVVQLAAQTIQCGDADIVVAGGAENMSQAPYVLPSFRWGGRMGDSKVVDTMIKDGLSDAFNEYHMGLQLRMWQKNMVLAGMIKMRLLWNLKTSSGGYRIWTF